MPSLADPLDVRGFAFLEFAAAEADGLERICERLGLERAGEAACRDLSRYSGGGVHALLNSRTIGRAARFSAAHGPSIHAMAFEVADGLAAFDEAVRRGASPVDPVELALDIPAVEGIGGTLIYLADRAALERLPGGRPQPNDSPLSHIDHVAQNVGEGEAERWIDFYARIFGFREDRRFEIRGRRTSLVTRVAASADGSIRIPINESPDAHSQIQDFLRDHGGEGIQHIAFATADICGAVDALHARGIDFQPTPDSYYDGLAERLPGHGENLDALRARGILLDGGAGSGRLLQIFTRNLVGPVFFELIQRKRHDGFGEGNITALFESVERDQMARGAFPHAMSPDPREADKPAAFC